MATRNTNKNQLQTELYIAVHTIPHHSPSSTTSCECFFYQKKVKKKQLKSYKPELVAGNQCLSISVTQKRSSFKEMYTNMSHTGISQLPSFLLVTSLNTVGSAICSFSSPASHMQKSVSRAVSNVCITVTLSDERLHNVEVPFAVGIGAQ